MNSEQVDSHQPESGPSEKVEREAFDTEELVAPGAPIVRSSTPRPLSFGLFESSSRQPQATASLENDGTTSFPIEAPLAPPLPVEVESSEKDPLHVVETTPLPGRAQPSGEGTTEFLWLFEYGLEMDVAILNSAERLNGMALLYGPAVLKGYEITFDGISSYAGQVVATLVPSRKPSTRVWGMLYRVPRRLAERFETQPALLDKIHSAVPPDGLFERCQVVVHEAHRAREVTSIMYIASTTARNQFHLLLHDRQSIDTSPYVRRLLEIARKQKLPDDYLNELATLTIAHESPHYRATTVERDTEPLPVLVDEKRALVSANDVQRTTASEHKHMGLMVFALYVVCSLLVVFALAFIQGMGFGSNLFSASFAPLGIPWFVLVYGLIGGCLSCIVTLERYSAPPPANFALITWFVRPYVGVIFAVLAYLLLNSGLFIFSASPEQQKAVFSLLALLAGVCEGWLFYKRR